MPRTGRAASLQHLSFIKIPRSLRGLDVGNEILHRDMSRSSWLRRHRLQVSRGINLAQLLDRHLLFLITVLLLLFSFHPTLLLLPFRLYHFLHLTILFHCLPSPNPPPPLGLPRIFLLIILLLILLLTSPSACSVHFSNSLSHPSFYSVPFRLLSFLHHLISAYQVLFSYSISSSTNLLFLPEASSSSNPFFLIPVKSNC